jgi:hypothetical protein
MVGSLPPIRHVIAFTAKDANKAGRSARELFVFFLNVGGIWCAAASTAIF